MKYNKILLTIFFSVFIVNSSLNAQAVSFFDAGQAFLKLNLEINDQVYTRISQYKVLGTQYLFGKQVNGNVYTEKEVGNNVQLSYNTYDQSLEIPLSNGTVKKTAAEIDSFTFVKDDKSFYKENYNFVSSNKYEPKNPFFLLKLVLGNKYEFYKKYYTLLGVVSTNYIQSELKQFDLKYEYYYVDLLSTDKKLQKLKTSKSSLKKTFSTSTQAMALLDSEGFDGNDENILKTLFIVLND